MPKYDDKSFLLTPTAMKVGVWVATTIASGTAAYYVYSFMSNV